jgi:hypothetical protein
MGLSGHAPAALPTNDLVPLFRRLGGFQGPVWTDVENLAPMGFDPRTVQPEQVAVPTMLPQHTVVHICLTKNVIYCTQSYYSCTAE